MCYSHTIVELWDLIKSMIYWYWQTNKRFQAKFHRLSAFKKGTNKKIVAHTCSQAEVEANFPSRSGEGQREAKRWLGVWIEGEKITSFIFRLRGAVSMSVSFGVGLYLFRLEIYEVFSITGFLGTFFPHYTANLSFWGSSH